MTDLTEDEKLWALRRATNSMEGCKTRWAERVQRGLTDEQLAEAIRYELGSFGGCSGPNGLMMDYAGDGLRIWAGHGSTHRGDRPPILQGPATVRLARRIYEIPDPTVKQLGLF